MQKIKSIWIS